MDFLKAVNIIGRDLEEAIALMEQLSGVSGPELAEVELARSRVRSAAEMVRLLPSLSESKENKLHSVPRQTRENTTTEHEKAGDVKSVPAESIKNTEEPVGAVITESEDSRTGPVHGEPEKDARDSSRIDDGNQFEITPVTDAVIEKEPESQSIARNTQEPSKAIFADRFTSGETVGEKISTGKKEEVVSSVIHGKPIADIASAIGINDRFYFIRELFSGDALAYNDTIRRLNAAASLGEAMKILDESTVMGSDPAAQSSFVDVVRRKFSLNV